MSAELHTLHSVKHIILLAIFTNARFDKLGMNENHMF